MYPSIHYNFFGAVFVGALFFVTALTVSAQQQNSMHVVAGDNIDLSEVELCDTPRLAGWRAAQTVDGVFVAEDPSCTPDRPELIAASVQGTNNVSQSTLNATGLAPDAVTKENDKDGDGDPDVIHIKLEIIGFNEGTDPVVSYEIAPGITPGLWTFAPKTTGMATEGMTASPLMRMPAPTIRVEQGDEVKVTIENAHYMPHTVHLHGVDHPYVDENGEGNDGVPHTSEKPIMPGESRTYDINPRTTGTMMYHCHVQPDVHVLMGLNGMFVIEENRPNNFVQTFNVGAGKVRHPSAASQEEYDGEFDLHYQDMDKELHEIVQRSDDPTKIARALNNEYDITERTSDYFTLNGKSFPYTMRDSQIIVDPNSTYRLRVVNGGTDSIALHTHGHKVRVRALDGVDLGEGNEYYRDVVDVHAAQRVDLELRTTDDGLNSYGEGVWFYHSHREAHITTDGTSPGGNISMITYRSFLNEDGMPEVQGVDLRPLFTPEYYEKKVDIWESYDLHNLFGRSDTDDGSARMFIDVILIAVAGGIIGLLLGVFFQRFWRNRKEHHASNDSAKH